MGGWLAVAFAVIMAITALALFAGSGYGALFGILIVLNAVVHLMSVGGHSVWSVIVIAVDGLIMYGLCVHGFGHGDDNPRAPASSPQRRRRRQD